MPGGDGTGPRMGPGRGGRGMGDRGRSPTACRCPRCGHRQPHSRGTPCNRVRCPKCGSPMARG